MRHAAALGFALAALFVSAAAADDDPPKSITPPPPRAEGDGPFPRLILRGVTVIDGTGAPPIGPMDVVIEQGRIVSLKSVGFPGVPIEQKGRPEARAGDKEMDLTGHYVLPGFVDMHGHVGGVEQGTPAEYVFKLWMAHGITTVRDPGSGNGLEWVLEQKKKSAANAITAPRLHAYVFFGQGRKDPIVTPVEARAWVAEVAKKGADGLKLFNLTPEM